MIVYVHDLRGRYERAAARIALERAWMIADFYQQPLPGQDDGRGDTGASYSSKNGTTGPQPESEPEPAPEPAPESDPKTLQHRREPQLHKFYTAANKRAMQKAKLDANIAAQANRTITPSSGKAQGRSITPTADNLSGTLSIGKPVKHGDTVSVRFEGRRTHDAEGKIFGSNLQPDAAPLTFCVGSSRVVPGFDRAMIGAPMLLHCDLCILEPVSAFVMHRRDERG